MLGILCIVAGIIALPIIVIHTIVTRSWEKPSPPPEKKDPIDQYMDENYADVDWLRNGKL